MEHDASKPGSKSLLRRHRNLSQVTCLCKGHSRSSVSVSCAKFSLLSLSLSLIQPPSQPQPQPRSTMRLPSNHHLARQQPTSFPTDTSSGGAGGASQYQGMYPRPAHSTRGAYVVTHVAPQRSMPKSTRAQSHRHPHALSRVFHGQSYPTPGDGVGAFDDYIATADSPAPPSTYTHSEIAHPTAISMTWMGVPEAPPPLDHNKSPYGCIPLPNITPGLGIPTLNPILAYAPPHSPEDAQTISQGHRYHMCAPATNPKLGSATILLPDGRGMTVQASLKGHDFVTVGDVLDALDTILLGRPTRELSLPGKNSCMGGSCWCFGGRTALGSLRSQYACAGLTRSEEGLDIWELRIG